MNEQELKKLIKEVASDIFMEHAHQINKQAVIVDNKDPDKKNRMKIRVSGVHASDLPEDQLPWVQVSPQLGANQGQGLKDILQIGQFIEVRPLTSGLSEWLITAGSSIVRQELGQDGSRDEDGQPYSSVKNKKLEKETIPKLASTEVQKLMDTVYGIIKQKLTFEGNNPEQADPPLPNETSPLGYRLYSKEADKRDILCYVSSEKNLGSLNEYFYFYDENDENIPPRSSIKASPDNTILELIDYENVNGWDSNGNKVYPHLNNWNLIIPPNISSGGSNTFKDYTIKYKVTDKNNNNISSTNEIKFRVAGIEYNQPSVTTINMSNLLVTTRDNGDKIFLTSNEHTNNGVVIASTPEYNAKEYDPEDEAGVTELKEISQYPNDIAITIDGSDDNAYYSIKHPTGSRLDFLHDGRAIIKSNQSMEIFADKNLLMNIGNMQELSAKTRINIKTPKLYIECDSIDIIADTINIKGDLNIVGDITMDGNIELYGDINQTGNQLIYGSVNIVNGDCIADGISLKNHKHMEQGDGAPTSPSIP